MKIKQRELSGADVTVSHPKVDEGGQLLWARRPLSGWFAQSLLES